MLHVSGYQAAKNLQASVINAPELEQEEHYLIIGAEVIRLLVLRRIVARVSGGGLRLGLCGPEREVVQAGAGDCR